MPGEKASSISNETAEFDQNKGQIDAVAVEALRKQREGKAKQFVNTIAKPLSVFMEDSSLTYVTSKEDETFCIYPKTGEIHVPEKWFTGEYSDLELRFSAHHEAAHFMDMRKNPETFMKNFEEAEEMSHKMAKEYLRKHQDCQKDEESIASFFNGELHSFNNVMDDIYVNSLVKNKSPLFSQREPRENIKTLYNKIGFGEEDQEYYPGQNGEDRKEIPFHRQMLNSMLREMMLADNPGSLEQTKVSPEVEEVLRKKQYGRTIFDIINDDVVSKYGGIQNDPGERHQVLRARIRPSYIDLLWKALEKQEQQDKEDQQKGQQGGQGGQGQNGEQQGGQDSQGQNGEQQGGQGGQGQNEQSGDQSGNESHSQDGDNFDPFHDGNNQQKPNKNILSKDIDKEKQILDDMIEAKRVEDMTPEERADYINKQKQEKFDDEHGITKNERLQHERTKKRIDSARKEMRKFWQSLIGKSINYERKYQAERTKGQIDVRSFIKHYPEYVSGVRRGDIDNLPIYGRYENEKQIVDKPDRIDITLLVDASGSMSGKRTQAAREAATLLALSIKDFNNQLDAKRQKTNSKLRARSEVYAFGTGFKKIKQFEKKDKKIDTSEAEIIKLSSAIDADMGGTEEYRAYMDIEQNLSQEDKNKIADGKLKRIVFEITDGSPNDISKTKEHIEALRKEGVIVYGFQITDNDGDRRSFDEIWNSDPENPYGIHIGDNVEDLPKKLIEVAGALLGDIRI